MGLILPPLAHRALRFVPPAVLAAIIFPEVLLTDGRLDTGLGNHRLLAAAAAVLVAIWTRKTMPTIVAGMAALQGGGQALLLHVGIALGALGGADEQPENVAGGKRLGSSRSVCGSALAMVASLGRDACAEKSSWESVIKEGLPVLARISGSTARMLAAMISTREGLAARAGRETLSRKKEKGNFHASILPASCGRRVHHAHVALASAASVLYFRGDVLVASPSRPPFAGGAGRLRFTGSAVEILDQMPSVQGSKCQRRDLTRRAPMLYQRLPGTP